MATTHLFSTTSRMTAVTSYCWGNKSCRNLEAWRNCRSLQLLVIDVFKKSNIWNIKSLSERKWSLKWDLYSLGYVPVRASARAQVPVEPAKSLNSLMSQDKYTNLIKCLKEGNLLPDALQVATTEPKHYKKTLLFFSSCYTNPQESQLWKILILLWGLL